MTEVQVYHLPEMIQVHDGQIASRTLSKKYNTDLPLTLYAFANGESVSQEFSERIKTLHVLSGNLRLELASGEQLTAGANDQIVIPAHTLHAIYATTDTKFFQIESTPRKEHQS